MIVLPFLPLSPSVSHVCFSDECGIVAQISQPLADGDISAYYISTFSFDHALVSLFSVSEPRAAPDTGTRTRTRTDCDRDCDYAASQTRHMNNRAVIATVQLD